MEEMDLIFCITYYFAYYIMYFLCVNGSMSPSLSIWKIVDHRLWVLYSPTTLHVAVLMAHVARMSIIVISSNILNVGDVVAHMAF